jgi:Flp pilus assembly protein TadD
MNRIAAFSVTSVLCALWLGACSSISPDEAKPAAPGPEKTQAARSDSEQAPNLSTEAATDPSKDLPTTLDGEIARAQDLRAKGDLGSAVSALAQLMLVAPDDPRVVGEYGKVLVEQGHAKDAEPYLARAIQLNPKDWKLYSALGVADDQLDNYADARLAYEHALALAPRQPSVLNNYAVSRMLSGDYAGAQRLLMQASAEDAANPKITNNLEKLASLRGPTAAASRQPAPAPSPGAVAHQPKLLPQPVEVRTALKSNPPVVMQSVPADPMAGPVKTGAPAHRITSAPKPTAVASTANPKQVAKVPPAPPPPPALRTTAELN